MSSLDEIFESAVRSRIFRDREKLLPDYIPERLIHREREITRLAHTLAVALRGERPNNIFIYGLTGTGKTAATKLVLRKLAEKAAGRNVKLYIAYVNVRQRDTPYRVMSDIAEALGVRVPFTGLSTGEVYRRFVVRANRMSGIMIIVLDEIDFLVRRHGDDLLYKLVRVNENLERFKVSLIGITNSVSFVESLDPRVKSSLGEEEIVFSPYNASQLRDILSERAREAFLPGVLDDDVVPLCAALAAREHGDARRALDLLRVAGEIAERRGDERVTKTHVMLARMEIERDRVVDVVKTLPLHGKLILASIVEATRGGEDKTTTGEVYDVYRRYVNEIGIEEVTFRRVSGIIGELDMLGVIRARTISRGRYGKTRVIELVVDPAPVLQVISDDPLLTRIAERLGGLVGKVRDSLR
ncbi:MAG: orc1/cdc6 family replication initiation protein [Desulfurococcales archaeon]|nr:orc1/cdc6 family replication initiation protein [Desulfurococcales archaeon]